METIKYNYEKLTQWIKTNPKIRTYSNFAKMMGYSVQTIHYHIMAETYMTDNVVQKAKSTFGFTDKQIDKFFYNVKKLSK